MSIARLNNLLRRLNLEPTAKELAEIIWLAAQYDASTIVEPIPPEDPTGSPETAPADGTRGGEGTLTEAHTQGQTESIVATASAAKSIPEADLYPAQAAAEQGETAARRFRAPAAHALPAALELGRSLRPLKRRVPSRTTLLIDEGATAHHIADSGDWTPVLRPAPERWLDIVLVVDESSSMVIWQRLIAEFLQLLERQGAFRTIQVYGFRPKPGNADLQLYSGYGPTARRNVEILSATLNDPLGRRLILVVSDCVAPIWHNGCMGNLLAKWGQKGIVALVQTLPERLWARTGLRTHYLLSVRSPEPGLVNTALAIRWGDSRPTPPSRDEAGQRISRVDRAHWRPAHSAPIPVVTLDALPLAYWARSVSGASGVWLPAIMAIPGEVNNTALPPTDAVGATLLNIFHSSSSAQTRRLAVYLSAVPLSLPIMRLVQRVMLPGSRQVHLAELFLSGLIKRPEPDDTLPADSASYDFVSDEVRAQLQKSLRSHELIDVLQTVSQYIDGNLGEALDFAALLADPTSPVGKEGIKLSDKYHHFARIAAGALRRFGGQFADVAERLEASADVTPRPIIRPVTLTSSRIEQTSTDTQPTTAVPGTLYPILVGIDQLNPDSGRSKLEGCVNDVRALQDYFSTVRSVSSHLLHVLTDQEATRARVLSLWRDLIQRLKPGDIVYFHFSGMGERIPSDDPNTTTGMDSSLVMYDSRNRERSRITHLELGALLDQTEAQGAHAILVIDASYAGSNVLARRSSKSIILAGCHEDGECNIYDTGTIKMGALTYFILTALHQADETTTWQVVYDQVLAQAKAHYTNQTPQLIGPGNQLLFSAQRTFVDPHLLVTGVNNGPSPSR